MLECLGPADEDWQMPQKYFCVFKPLVIFKQILFNGSLSASQALTVVNIHCANFLYTVGDAFGHFLKSCLLVKFPP